MSELELPIPQEIVDDANAVEMVRAWVSEGDLVVSMHLGMESESPEGESSEAAAWAGLLADITRHFARSMQEDEGQDEADTMEQVRSIYNGLVDMLKTPEEPAAE